MPHYVSVCHFCSVQSTNQIASFGQMPIRLLCWANLQLILVLLFLSLGVICQVCSSVNNNRQNKEFNLLLLILLSFLFTIWRCFMCACMHVYLLSCILMYSNTWFVDDDYEDNIIGRWITNTIEYCREFNCLDSNLNIFIYILYIVLQVAGVSLFVSFSSISVIYINRILTIN